jgi:AcrR family transcriptional regulator
VPTTVPTNSPRRDELLERSYRYVLEHGVGDLSLRPLATEVNSSPRVLLFLFGSKAELLKALLARARQDELDLLNRMRSSSDDADLATVASRLWQWLVADEHRALLTLWVEGYARSLLAPDGPWTDFARSTVNDWLAVLADVQPRRARNTAGAKAERTLVLAVLRGAMLDLLATGDVQRTTNAIEAHLILLRSRPRPPEARDIARP